jgi:hypothetical protein
MMCNTLSGVDYAGGKSVTVCAAAVCCVVLLLQVQGAESAPARPAQQHRL